MNDTTLFLLAAAADKAAPARPALPAGKHPGGNFEVHNLDTGEAALLRYDGVTVGAESLATATCSVSMYGVLARALRHAGCTREAVARLVTEATAAELRGDPSPDGVAEEVKALVEALRAAFAASLPRVHRAGAVSVKGARFEAAAAAEVAAK